MNCYSRIVPERIDDYAWENDKVAFRTYGPAAQKLVEQGKKGGIISSGIDCWLKKVNYPVINKWYNDSEEKGIIELTTKYIKIDSSTSKEIEENIYIMKINCSF